jgi:TetR/AcrR family transcriptional regulator, transcriptional repressor for nem operon
VPRPSMKSAIVEAGRDEFHGLGYTATGVAAITSRARVPKGSFYNHFDSKEDLALEVLRLYVMEQRLDILTSAELAPLDRVREHFSLVARQLGQSEPINGCMFANFAAEISDETPRLRASVVEGYAYWARLLADNLREAAGPGSEFDAGGLASALIDAYEGAAVRARASNSREPVEVFLTRTLPLLLAAVPQPS